MAEINVDIKPNKNSLFLWNEVLPTAVKDGSLLRWVILEGSSRSGKTWAIVQFLVCLCLNPALLGRNSIVVRCYRNDATTTQGTVLDDFVEIMTKVFGGLDANGEWVSLMQSAGVWNSTLKRYTFTNGSTFQFLGANDAQKLQGKKATVSWLNEAMEITDAARRQIDTRTELFMICDFNPSETAHWIFNKVMTNPEWYLYCHSTYKDNRENLTPRQIYTIECTEPTPENIKNGTADARFWDVYGLGKRGQRDGQVFPRIHWDLIDDKDFPDISVCQRFGYGMDFGFSQDPSVCVECAFSRDALFVREIFYDTGLLIGKNSEDPNIPSIQGLLDDAQISKLTPIFCDSAYPQEIAFLRACGYNAQPCRKGAGSINAGLDLLKQFRIYVVRSSQNIQTEFENYAYKQRPDGTFTDIPEDRYNHAIDAIRYWGERNLISRLLNAARDVPAYKPVDLYDQF